MDEAVAGIQLVTSVLRLVPALKNATRNVNIPGTKGLGGGGTYTTNPAANVHPAPPRVDPERERRAYETVNYVLRTLGSRVGEAGLVSVPMLSKALTEATMSIDVKLFSTETNRLFESLASKLNDPVLVNSVFTSIYLISFLTAELQGSLPNYKDTYTPLGPRLVQQLFMAAIGQDAFRENHTANLGAYQTLAKTAGLLRPTDLERATFPGFPSFRPCRYSSKTFKDTRNNRLGYERLVKHFEFYGFPQPLKGRDVGEIRDWRFLSGDSNTRAFEVEKADKHIGENFGRVLHWLICSADRIPPGEAVIAYLDQHIELIKWMGSRMGYRAINAATDIHMVGPHAALKKELRDVFNTWVILMPSESSKAKRRQSSAQWAQFQQRPQASPQGPTNTPVVTPATTGGPQQPNVPTGSPPAQLQSTSPAASPPPYSPYKAAPAAAEYPFPRPASVARRKAPPRPEKNLVLALYDFDPEDDNDEELPFKEGDILEIVEKSAALEEEGWCRARLKDSQRIGLAPLEYLEELRIEEQQALEAKPISASQGTPPNPLLVPPSSSNQASIAGPASGLGTVQEIPIQHATTQANIHETAAAAPAPTQVHELPSDSPHLSHAGGTLGHSKNPVQSTNSPLAGLTPSSDVGMTPLDQAAEAGHISIVDLPLKGDGRKPVNIKYSNEQTPLHLQSRPPEIEVFSDDPIHVESAEELRLLPDLSPLSLEDIQFLRYVPLSWADHLKAFAEDFSGEPWNWWPLSSRTVPLLPGNLRVQWTCRCGERRWSDLPEASALKYLENLRLKSMVANTAVVENENQESPRAVASSGLLKSIDMSMPNLGTTHPGVLTADQGNGNNAPTSNPPVSNASSSSVPSTTLGQTQKAPSLPNMTPSAGTAAAPGHSGGRSNSPKPSSLYILFCAYRGRKLQHTQIEVSKKNDDEFFNDLRREYISMRGWLRYYFDPRQFDHCDFVKFTRFYVDELARICHDLPDDLMYQYYPRPPAQYDDPPIVPHEFYRRFYYVRNTYLCLSQNEALSRIPKRSKRFQVNLHVGGREDMWGLHAELRPFFWMVAAWMLVILTGGFVFWGWWMSRHPGDWQNASVPFTAVLGCMMMLLLPLNERFKSPS